MFKFVLVSALLVASWKQAYSGFLGGHGGLSLDSFSAGGGDESYGGASLGSLGGFDANSAAAAGSAALAGLDTGSAGLQQSGGSGGGDFHGGVSVVSGGSSQQGQTLDLTGHGGNDHGGKVFGGSFISAGVSGKSGGYADDSGDGGYDAVSFGGHEGLGAYSGASSYDVGGHGGEISGVLSSSVKEIPDEAFSYH